jgi:hypothetical protein
MEKFNNFQVLMNYMKDQLIHLLQEFIGENNTFAGEVSDVSGDKCKVKLNSGTEILGKSQLLLKQKEKRQQYLLDLKEH